MPTPERAGYIRGAGGANISSRNIARGLVGFWVLLLACLGTVLIVQASHQTSRDHRLQHSGVAVQATVTHCFGRAAGTGVTPTGFTCSGTFAFGGKHYTDVIGGNSALLLRGTVLRAVTDPDHLSVLSTTNAVATTPAAWKNFIAAGVVIVLLLLSAAAAARWHWRSASGRSAAAAALRNESEKDTDDGQTEDRIARDGVPRIGQPH